MKRKKMIKQKFIKKWIVKQKLRSKEKEGGGYDNEGYLLSKLYELPLQEFRTQKILLSVVPLIE
jgi:hypothetical protein